jgi:NADH dehydrogenase
VGGTGFIGKYVVKLLAERGFTIRVIARNPETALQLKTAGDPGQIVLMKGDLSKPESLQDKINGSWAVVNLVGILFENSRQNFAALHSVGAEKLAQMAKHAGVQRYVHMSSLGVDKAVKSKYARTKSMGEKTVRAAFPEATILRPSVVFGAEDNFYNNFANMATFSPALPLIGGGMTRFQPVYVMDVARAVLVALEAPEAIGETYELGGPATYSFKEVLGYICKTIGRKPALLTLPFGLMRFAATFTEFLPNPPLTRDQITMLEMDNVVSPGAKTFADLGIMPTAVEAVVPHYLKRFAKLNLQAAA